MCWKKLIGRNENETKLIFVRTNFEKLIQKNGGDEFKTSGETFARKLRGRKYQNGA